MSACRGDGVRVVPLFALLGSLWLVVLPAWAQEDIADVRFEEVVLDGGPGRYFLIGDAAEPPDGGFGLIVVMPGGDGSADFRPFVQRIYKYAVPEGYLVAQPVAVSWREGQQIIWPTRGSRVPGMRFTTEQYVEHVVKDVGRRVALHPDRRVLMGWSSSGPAVYAVSVQPAPPVGGYYIAMSVFKPDQLGPLRHAAGRPFRIEHARGDRVCPFRMAEQAREQLTEAGAVVRFVETPGGHGWQGPIWQRMTEGFRWFDEMLSEGTPLRQIPEPKP